MEPYKGRPTPGMLAVGPQYDRNGLTGRYVVGVIDEVADRPGGDWSIAVYVPRADDRLTEKREPDREILWPDAVDVGSRWRSLAILFHLTDANGNGHQYPSREAALAAIEEAMQT
jgi:hypothetical protein